MIQSIRRRAAGLRANLWSLIVPPTVWSLHFLFCYVYAAIQCAKGGHLHSLDAVRLAVAAATTVALLAVAASAYVAWAQMRIEGDPPPHQESTEEDRHRFLATAKLLLAALSFVAILYTAIPAVIFADCR
jgi:hypothetical protein